MRGLSRVGRPRTPPGVGTPLRAADPRHPLTFRRVLARLGGRVRRRDKSKDGKKKEGPVVLRQAQHDRNNPFAPEPVEGRGRPTGATLLFLLRCKLTEEIKL